MALTPDVEGKVVATVKVAHDSQIPQVTTYVSMEGWNTEKEASDNLQDAGRRLESFYVFIEWQTFQDPGSLKWYYRFTFVPKTR